MQFIQLTTKIAAPIERCFLLSLNLDLHKASTVTIIDGVRSGIIGPKQTVTWRAKQFGLWLTHTTLISEYERPIYFRDEMMHGTFKSYVHDHHFEAQPDGTTLMRDELHFAAPLGPFGWLAETLVLRKHLIHLLQERNHLIQTTAEAPEQIWAPYLRSA